MTEHPIISVIVPVRNTKEYLPICLDTMRSQTISSLEVLIIDDCSDQNIRKIVEPYLSDSRFRYYRLEQCLGPGGARNAGLDAASGKYIGFCDSDDWVDLNFYETAVKFMDRSGADIGMCTLMRETDGSAGDHIYKCKYDQAINLSPDIAIKIMTYQYDAGIKVIPPCTNKIYRKAFLDRFHVRFQNHMYFQDVLFAFQTFLQAGKIICIPNVRYHHFRRPDSIIQSFSSKHIDDFAQLFSLISAFLKEKGLYEQYQHNYYKLCEHFYNIIVREIFQFVQTENEKKQYLRASFVAFKQVVNLDEYLEYTTAEKLRQHIQPHILDTTLY